MLDTAKGLGILCIFIGHLTYWGTPISKFVFSFHLSLFFFISGWLFHSEKYDSLQKLLKKLWLTLGVPYVVFIVLGCFVLPFRDEISWLNFGAILKSIFYTGHPKVNGPLWFLVSLAGVELVYWVYSMLLKMSLRRDGILLVISSAATACAIYVLHCYPGIRQIVPLKLETLPAGLFFFVLGRFAQKIWIGLVSRLNRKRCLLVGVLAFIGLVCCLPFAKPSCLQGSQIRDVLFSPMSFMGIAMVLMVSCVICDKFPAVTYIGRNSLCFFSLEFVTLPVLLWVGRIFDERLLFYPLDHMVPLSYSFMLLLLQVLFIGIIVSPVSKILDCIRNVCKRGN